MGWGAARKLRTVGRQPRAASSRSSSPARRAGSTCARRSQPAAGTGAAVGRGARAASPGAGPDRWLAPELAAAEELVGARRAADARSRRAIVGA